MTAKNQLMKADAQKVLDYRDGGLYWRHAGSGQRDDRRAIRVETRTRGVTRVVEIGGVRYQAKYAVWNWHYGIADGPVRHLDGDQANLRIENLTTLKVLPRDFIHVQSTYKKSRCPCCQHKVAVPSFDVVVMNCDLSPLHERILSVIWSAKGRPVMTDRIFQAMYIDDPEGGPSPNKMYGAFKVALHHMRTRLEGSGVSIVNNGYRQGYRLVLGGN